MTLIDDATLPGYIGSLNMDDEGTPGQRTVLIEDGVLVGYMHDWISARHFKTARTGNGRRQNYHHYPVPRMTNTFLLGGEADPGGDHPFGGQGCVLRQLLRRAGQHQQR